MTGNAGVGRNVRGGALALAPWLCAALCCVHEAAAADVEVVVPAAVMHGVEGLTFGDDGVLYGASIHGGSVYRIDPRTGIVRVAVPSPQGEADDVAVGPAGTPVAGILAWTAQSSGEIRIQRPGHPPEVLMRDVPRVNPIAFNADGRLFMAQLGAGEDTLWELDLIGGRAPRAIASNQFRLNGFGFGADGRLYAPLFGTDHLLSIDVNTGEYRTIASGVGAPAAAKVHPGGDVFSVDYLRGDLWRTHPATGESHIVASLREPLDNLAIDRDGIVFVSNPADSRVSAIDPATGAQREVVQGWFSVPLGMSAEHNAGRPAVLVADPFGYRHVDPVTGVVTRPPWASNRGASSAVAADDRFIAFSYARSARVRKIDRSSDQIVMESTAFKAPRGVALDSHGDVIVADAQGNNLLRLSAAGVVELATGLRQPVGLALESDTSALVTEFASGTLSRVDLTTGQHTEIASGLGHPTAVARLPDGRLAVIVPDRREVVAIDPQTGTRTVLARGLALALDGLDLPADTNGGIAAGDDGSVLVSCPGDNSIVRIGVARRHH